MCAGGQRGKGAVRGKLQTSASVSTDRGLLFKLTEHLSADTAQDVDESRSVCHSPCLCLYLGTRDYMAWFRGDHKVFSTGCSLG